jgi:uroporphyrinogen decarboxylase
MTKRQIVIDALKFKKPAYVPWEWGPTIDSYKRLQGYLKIDDLNEFLDHHIACTGAALGPWEDIGNDCVRDNYGVVWDRTVDKDIGTPCDCPIKTPADLARYKFPDVDNPKAYEPGRKLFSEHPEAFAMFDIGFSLYERAWTMRGMSEFLMDMIERPEFVDELLDAICERNLVQIKHALELNVDCVHFGDDYGMQTGLIMGIANWRRFIKPRLARMYAPVVKAGKFCSLHSCGRVDSLFDDLTEIGLNMFNPFQPEVMDTFGLIRKYRGKLAFHGGMSVQKVLPFGTVAQVRDMTKRLIEAGSEGGYVFAPSHAVPRDVPPENLVAMVEVLKAQPGYGRGA